MNIFVTDEDPVKAAKNLCDKHISKMIVESAQMLSTTHWILAGGCPGKEIYKVTHENHPCSKWVRESDGNYHWLWEHATAMCYEYTRRYERIHKTEALIQCLRCPPNGITNYGQNVQTHFVVCFFSKDPESFNKCFVPNNPVQSYRNYYKLDKARFAKWAHSDVPSWW